MKLSFILMSLTLSIPLMINAQKTPLIDSRELINQAIGLHDSGEYRKAIALYNQVDRNDTNYVWSLYERALSCEADSQFDLGIKYCKEALALKTQREHEANLYTEYGDILSDLEQYPKAMEVYDEGLTRYPSFYLILFNKGIVRFKQGRWAEAEEQFRQTVLINPYMYSAHYFLGIAALKQGKIIPGMLSLMGYLLINPEGKYNSRIISILDAIANGKDEIMDYRNKRTAEPGESFATTEEIILSKIALEKEYKPLTALDDHISRQIQVLLEKQEFSEKDPDFWIQYYVPVFKKFYTNGRFELLINRLFENVNIEIIQNYNKKHKKEMQDLIAETAGYFNEIRSTRELQFSKRANTAGSYLYNDDVLQGKGKTLDGKTLLGSWEFYYPQGNRRSTGQFDDNGNRTGDWLYYYYHDQMKAKEHYKDGQLDGQQVYYFDNGQESSREMYTAGKPDGIATTYYRAGREASIYRFKMGKPDGEKKEFYSNGAIHYITNFNAGVRNGIFRSYYKTGQLNEESIYQHDLLEGNYKSYYENGNLFTEGQFSKGRAEGNWKYYYESGPLKSKRYFENDTQEGAYEEYFENGQLKETSRFKKGKINGESLYYDKDGKLSSRIIFDNDAVQSAQYLDKSGKQISVSERKDNGLSLDTYNPDGSRKSHLNYDQKGNLTGTATYFYPSGNLSETDEYRDGKTEGVAVVYYRNGKKKSETPMSDGKENGYYTGYFSNGQISGEGWFRNGIAQGEWIYHDELGNLASKTYYLNGEISGFKEDFLPNGKKSLEQKYFIGWLDNLTQFDSTGRVLTYDSFPKGSGKYLLFYADGSKMTEGYYVMGDLDGRYASYYFDGSPESIQYYKKGLSDSCFQSFYYGGGKATVGQFAAGKKTGIWTSYDEDGKLSSSTTYVNDQMNGSQIFYNNDGSKDFEILYKNNQRNGLATKNDPDGSLSYGTHYEEDDLIAYTYADTGGKLIPEIPLIRGAGSLKSFFHNGKPSRQCNFRDGKVNGPDILYYSNGQIRSTDSSDYGLYEGARKEYYPNGKIKHDFVYLSDNLNGVCREYNEKGLLVREMNMTNGVLHGMVRNFNDDGKLRQTRLYYYGKLLSVKNEE